MRRSVPSMVAVAATCALLGVAGCGSDDDNGSSGGGSGTDKAADGGGGYGGAGGTSGGGSSGETLKLSADPGGELKFTKSSLSAKAGKVTIVMDNPSSATAPHAIEVEGNGVEEEGKTVQPGGGTSTVSADLKAGTYEFYCPVDGHKAAGMEGKLTVK